MSIINNAPITIPIDAAIGPDCLIQSPGKIKAPQPIHEPNSPDKLFREVLFQIASIYILILIIFTHKINSPQVCYIPKR